VSERGLAGGDDLLDDAVFDLDAGPLGAPAADRA